MIGRQDVVQTFGGFGGRCAFEWSKRRRKLADFLTDQLETGRIVLGGIVRDAAGARVEASSAQRLGIGDLADRALHQVRSAQAHEAGAFDHNNDVGQRGQVGSTGDAHAHHGGDLRDLQAAAHERVVVEDPRGSISAGENAVLIRKVHAGGIDQVDDRDAIAHGDFLGAQDFRNRFGPPRAGLHCGIVGDDHGGASFDAADAGDDARGGSLAVIFIEGDQQSDFEEESAGVDQFGDPFARGELPFAMLLFDFLRAAAGAELVFQVLKFGDQRTHSWLIHYCYSNGLDAWNRPARAANRLDGVSVRAGDRDDL